MLTVRRTRPTAGQTRACGLPAVAAHVGSQGFDRMATLLSTVDRPPRCQAIPEPSAGTPGPILILGAPRSGTSWLGKIFDSHPSVIYRHEPDDVIGQTEFPTVCPVEDIPAYAAAAEQFVARLTTVRQIKSSGTWPIFAKPFQRFPAPVIRRALVLILRACQQIAPAARSLNRIPIPDMIRGDAERLNVVIKSVSMLGDAALLASALPQCRIIAVFRHPCGHIASVKR